MAIAYDVRDTCAILRMDDGRVNAIDSGWCEALDAALDRAEADQVASIVLLGRPGCFCAGLDIKRLPKLAANELAASVDAFVAAMARLFLFPRPVVAASAGHVLAGGMILFLAADSRLAVDDDAHRYGLNEVRNGVPLIGTNAGICQAGIPVEHRVELMLHGQITTARELHDRRVIHSLAEASDDLEQKALALATGLATLDPDAYAITKKYLRAPALERAEAASRSLAGEIRTNPLANL